MFLDLLLIVAGTACILFGADRLTEGAVAMAAKLKIPEFVIGLTIVAFGTSAPELAVSLSSALKGTADMAMGNIIGSNIVNVMFIIGVVALILPIATTRAMVKKDIPFAIVASIILLALCYDRNLSRWDAIILLVVLCVFMYNTLRAAKAGKLDEQAPEVHTMATWKAIAWFIVGLGGLVYGSNLFVDAATNIARTLGMSDAVIGLTIVAGGTALPELATSVVAARKGNSAIAIGNVVGSNVLNILLILGLTGLISPMENLQIQPFDYGLMLFSMVLLWLFSHTKYRIERWEGALLVVLYVAYTGYLIVQ